MTPAELDRLFDGASARVFCKRGGHGLGLCIARHLVKLHGGQVCVSSIPGRGTTFDFYIQALVRRPQPRASPREEPRAVISRPPRCAVLHCLVVDDNYIIRRVLAQQLNIFFSVASDGLKALAVLK